MDSRKLTRRSFLKFAGFSLLGLGLGLVSSPRPARSRGRGQGPLTLSYPLSLDAIPLEFAHKRGLFQAHGLKVELLLLPEDLSRREAFISGRLDGLICDLSTVVFGLTNAGAEIAVTSTAFESIGGARVLALMGSGPFRVHTLEELFSRISGRSHESIMILQETDMHFATDQLLESLGREFDDRVIYTEGGDLINIYTLLIGGSVLAAVLPEPLATLAGPKDIFLQERDRAFYLSTYEGIRLMPSVISFQRRVLEGREKELELFYEVYSKAVEEINRAPREEFLELMAEIGVELFNRVLPEGGLGREDLPEGFLEIFDVPQFPRPRQLREEELEVLVAWARRKGFIREEVSYAQVVDNRFLMA